MDATSFIASDVAEMAVTCNVWRKSDGDAYGGDFEEVGDVDVRIFAPNSSNQVVVEGSGEETSMTGLVVPSYDSNEDIVHNVEVNDQIRVNGKRYDVRVKDGVPNELDPDIWRLGLDKANSN